MQPKRPLPSWLSAQYKYAEHQPKIRKTVSAPDPRPTWTEDSRDFLTSQKLSDELSRVTGSEEKLLSLTKRAIQSVKAMETKCYELWTRIAVLERDKSKLAEELEQQRVVFANERQSAYDQGVAFGKVVMHGKFQDLLRCKEFAYELKYGSLPRYSEQ